MIEKACAGNSGFFSYKWELVLSVNFFNTNEI